MSFGRALVLGLALASATAAALASAPIDLTTSVSLNAPTDGASDPGSAPPPFVLTAPVAPRALAITVSTALADRVRAPVRAAAPPLGVAPKTSPPQA